MSFIAAILFSILFLSISLSSSSYLQKLLYPIVLISLDYFRFGYQFKIPTPNIHCLIHNGIETLIGLIFVFPIITPSSSVSTLLTTTTSITSLNQSLATNLLWRVMSQMGALLRQTTQPKTSFYSTVFQNSCSNQS